MKFGTRNLGPVGFMAALFAIASCRDSATERNLPGGNSPSPPIELGSPPLSNPSPPVTVDMPGPCAPIPRLRVKRLSDRHLGNAIRDLLGLERTPRIQTVAGSSDGFIPNVAPGISGAVAVTLRQAVEAAAAETVAPGKAAVACQGDEEACARAFIAPFGPRSFRRPLAAGEADHFLDAYREGRSDGGTHADGIRTVIESALLSPSFLYQTRLGGPQGIRLTSFELATALSLFLRDSIPDDALWKAAQEDRLVNDEGLDAEIARMLTLTEVQQNLSRIFERLFQLGRMQSIVKDEKFTAFTPSLAAAMREETRRFIDDVLWRRDGTIKKLFLSRATTLNPELASLYGLPKPPTLDFATATLPEAERAGILTQASILTMGSSPDESSVVHRAVFISKELLCLLTPMPTPTDLQQGNALKMMNPTERARAEARARTPRCAGCHGLFDPLGIAFEGYDAIGAFRTTISTPSGIFPVDTRTELNTLDLRGSVENAIDLSRRLSESRSVKACLVRQLASYAGQEAFEGDVSCALQPLVAAFDRDGGNLVNLIRAIARSDGFVNRSL